MTTPVPAQLQLPGIPLPPPPIAEEVKTILLPITVNERGAHLRFVAMCQFTYADVGTACEAASAMGLV